MSTQDTQQLTRNYRWMSSITVLLGTIALGFSATMVMVALPEMMTAFNVGQEVIQWLATGFQVTATTSILATGWLAGRFGLRRVYIFTLLLFVGVSLLGAISWNAQVAIFARVMQGIAMGLVPAVALISIARVFPPQAVGMAMGVFGVGAVLAPAVGPAVGGVLLGPFGWPVIFLFPLLFCLPALLLAFKYVPEADPTIVHGRFDWLGMVLLTVFIFALLNITGLGLSTGWTTWQTLGCVALTVVSLVWLVFWQLRCKAPLVELSLFRNPRFWAVFLVAVPYGFCLYGTTYLIPYFLQSAAGYSPADSGAMQVPGGIILVLVIFSAGALCDKLSARTVTIAGLFLFALASIGFTFTTAVTGFWVVAAWFTLSRVAMGMLIPSTTVAAIQSVPPALLPYASTTMNFFMQLGGAIGINVLAILYQSRLEGHAITNVSTAAFEAFHECFWLAALLMVGALTPAVFIRKSLQIEPEPGSHASKIPSCP